MGRRRGRAPTPHNKGDQSSGKGGSDGKWLTAGAFIVTTTLTVFGYLSYVMEIRLCIIQQYGVYWLGVADGVVITVTVVAVAILITYLLLRLSKRIGAWLKE